MGAELLEYPHCLYRDGIDLDDYRIVPDAEAEEAAKADGYYRHGAFRDVDEHTDENPVCGATRGDYSCELPMAHSGQHRGDLPGERAKVWGARDRVAGDP